MAHCPRGHIVQTSDQACPTCGRPVAPPPAEQPASRKATRVEVIAAAAAVAVVAVSIWLLAKDEAPTAPASVAGTAVTTATTGSEPGDLRSEFVALCTTAEAPWCTCMFDEIATTASDADLVAMVEGAAFPEEAASAAETCAPLDLVLTSEGIMTFGFGDTTGEVLVAIEEVLGAPVLHEVVVCGPFDYGMAEWGDLRVLVDGGTFLGWQYGALPLASGAFEGDVLGVPIGVGDQRLTLGMTRSAVEGLVDGTRFFEGDPDWTPADDPEFGVPFLLIEEFTRNDAGRSIGLGASVEGNDAGDRIVRFEAGTSCE